MGLYRLAARVGPCRSAVPRVSLVNMMLKLLGQFRDVDATEGEATTSRHSGRSLREVEVEFNCGDALREQVTAELNAARDVDAALESDDGARWLVGSHSHSNVHGGAWHFTVPLIDVDVVQAERLEFGGMSFEPQFYREDAESDDDPLVITAELHPSSEQEDERLEQLIRDQFALADVDEFGYFSLVRHGVTEAPLQVRFGRCLWTKPDGPGAAREHLVVFVSEEGDSERKQRGVNFDEPRSGNAARIALQGRDMAEALLEELQANGVLQPEALERVRQRTASALERHFRELNEARDLKEFH